MQTTSNQGLPESNESTDLRDQATGSHPLIQYRPQPVAWGPLVGFETIRDRIIEDVVQQSVRDSAGESHSEQALSLLIAESLYLERQRIKKNLKYRPGKLYTISRNLKDKKFWGAVQSQLRDHPSREDRIFLIKQIHQHYAREIGGHFNPAVYRFATKMLPWCFSWLLNAASVQRFLPWGMTESLQTRLRILGEVPLVQRLSQKGTILLVPTHQSNIDSVLIGYIIHLMGLPPFSYGAGLNLFSNPVLSFFMSSLGAYTVDREKGSNLYKNTLKNYSAAILKEGVHSIFFPGGGRSRDGSIESKLKLGLLGTGLRAQIHNLQAGKPNPKVFVVPWVTSFHFVLEASSLIEQYLAQSGKHRFMGAEVDGVLPPLKVLNFFWQLFSSRSEITVRIGRPLDIFGNLVDDQGHSLGPNGTIIDPVKWLSTNGKLCEESQRDQEYTRELGHQIVERYYRENVVLSSHLVAFTFFLTLRKKYPQLDLYRFLRLTKEQRSLAFSDYLKEAEVGYQRLRHLANSGKVFMSDELINSAHDTESWVQDGMKKLGQFHGSSVVKRTGDVIFTENLSLLYYYRNRLSGYGLSVLADVGRPKSFRGDVDEQGFLV